MRDEERARFQEALDVFHQCGRNKTEAAKLLNIPYETLRNRVYRAEMYKMVPTIRGADPEAKRQIDMRRELKDLRLKIKDLESQSYDLEKVKEIIHECRTVKVDPPKWITPKQTVGVNTGIPLLFLSDWHWGEVIYPEQVNYVNAFNLKIAARRAQLCFEKCVSLLIEHMAKPDYPYITVGFGGDMLSGNIHEELRETNELPIAKTIMHLVEHVKVGLRLLADKFGKVVIYAIPGNHGRFDKKPRFKNRVYENFEWIFYQFLAFEFKNDDRFWIHISDSPDCLFTLYNTTYLMSHGDQFKGGEGVSGAFSPIVRGDLKKRQRQMAIRQPYDFMMVGHWHQHITPSLGTIVNGSLKGFDEFALEKNYGFQVPLQAMWLTHPDYGITARWPIYLERQNARFA